MQDQDFVRLLVCERFQEALGLIDLLPSSWWREWQRGIALSGISHQPEAIKTLHRVVETAPASHQAKCQIDLAVAYCRQGDWQQATHLLDVIAANGRNALSDEDAHYVDYVRGFTLMRKGDLDQAIASVSLTLTAARQLRFERLQTICGATLLCLYRLTGQTAQFQKLFVEIWSIAQRQSLVYRLAAIAYEAATVAESMGQSNHASHCIQLAEYYGSICGAEILRGDIATFHANRALAQGNLIDCASFLQSADDFYQQSHFLAGRSVCAFNSALVWQYQGNYAQALTQARLSEQFALQTNDAYGLRTMWLMCGYLYRHLGNRAYACHYLTKALRGFEDTGDWGLAVLAATELCQMADQESIAELKATIDELFVECDALAFKAAALRSYAQLYASESDWAQAIAQLNTAKRLATEANATVEQARCEILLAEYLLKSTENDSNDPLATQHIVTLLHNVEAKTLGIPEFDLRRLYVRAICALRNSDSDTALNDLLLGAQAADRLRPLATDPMLAGYLSANVAHIFITGMSVAYEHQKWDHLLFMAQLRRMNWIAQRSDLSLSDADQHTLDSLTATAQELRQKLNNRTIVDITEYDKRMQRLHQSYQQFDHYAHTLSNSPSLVADTLSPETLASHIDIGGSIAAFQREFISHYGDEWSAIIFEPLDYLGNEWVLMQITAHTFTARKIALTPMMKYWLGQATRSDNNYPQVIYGQPMHRYQVGGSSSPRIDALQMIAKWLDVDQWIPQTAQRNHPLFIVDCEPFSRLAFAALPTADKVLGDCATIRHMIGWSRFQSKTLRHPTPRAVKDWRVLIIAPISFGQDNVQLPASHEEVNQIKVLWPTATVLSNHDASLTKLRALHRKQQLADFDFIYIASHIVFDQERPRLTSILLTAGELTAQEIATWNISANLVCVAGCQGGRSYNPAGEERLGIEAAFLGAGAANVMTNLWPVKDDVTAHFMTTFLSQIYECAQVHAALRTTSVLAQDEPLFNWAGWRITQAYERLSQNGLSV